jgi:hypothetical protein
MALLHVWRLDIYFWDEMGLEAKGYCNVQIITESRNFELVMIARAADHGG